MGCQLETRPECARKEIEQILQENASAPWFGLAGGKFINVLEVNLELRKQYGMP
jgi:K+-transporting ATPase ATPase C chain